LSELRQQKTKLSRQVRDKEEELENSLTKIDSLRQDIRKAEKLRRELEVRADEAVTEAAKEKKSREKFEAAVRQMEKDMAALKAGGMAAAASPDGSSDVARLKGELERLEVATQETLLAQQVSHFTNLAFRTTKFSDKIFILDLRVEM
jgi:serine/threonine-protein kinase MRCK